MKKRQKMCLLLLSGVLALTLKVNTSAAEPTDTPISIKTASEYQQKRQSRSDEVVVINETTFPDENFRNYVSSELDRNNNGELTISERNNVISIDVSELNIQKLDGIEFFVNLRILRCFDNELTTLDLSSNTELVLLSCYNNKLTTLNVSQNSKLKSLDCGFNKLTTLDLSNNTELTTLWCANNELTTLDISNNTELVNVYGYANELTEFIVGNNTILEKLNIYDNKLTSLPDMTNLGNLNGASSSFENNYLTEQELIDKLPGHLVTDSAWLEQLLNSQQEEPEVPSEPETEAPTPQPAPTPAPQPTPQPTPAPQAPVTAPAVPTGVSAITTSRKSATISWKKVTGATGYEVHRSTNKSTGFRQVANLGANATSFTDSSLAEGKTYYYKVRAKNATGYKDSSVITVRTVAKATALKLKKTGNKLRISYKSTEKRFQIQVSRKKKSGYKNVATNHKKKSLTVNNSKIRKALKLKKGRSYTVYVRVRSFRTVNNKRVYSSWTTPRRVKKLNMK